MPWVLSPTNSINQFVRFMTNHTRNHHTPNTKQPKDSKDYTAKKSFYAKMLTLFGRNVVLEALQQSDATPWRLHLADSNRPAKILDDIEQLARKRGAEVVYHKKDALSRISKNSRQDQGVCLDIQCAGYNSLDAHLEETAQQAATGKRYIALDRVTNPQNLGMIIRSVTAGGMDGIILPEKGCAKIDPLVIKASAGTLFKASILRCKDLASGLKACQQQGGKVVTLSSHAPQTLSEVGSQSHQNTVFVLGNESEGVSATISQLADQQVRIPMHNGVESLNVAITAALIAFNHT